MQTESFAGRPIVKGGGMPNQFSSNAIDFQQVQRKMSQQNLQPPNHPQMKPQNSPGAQPFNSSMEFQQVNASNRMIKELRHSNILNLIETNL